MTFYVFKKIDGTRHYFVRSERGIVTWTIHVERARPFGSYDHAASISRQTGGEDPSDLFCKSCGTSAHAACSM